MPHVSLIHLQRGPAWKVIISILRVGGKQDTAEKTTETIIVDDMVEVSFKLAFAVQVTPYVRMKLKKDNEHNTVALVQVQATIPKLPDVKIINKQFFCSTEWVELEMSSIGYYFSEAVNGVPTWSYFIDVDITASKYFHAASLPYLPNIDKLYQDIEFTDFQLCAADGNVTMHKAFLAANSDVFKAMMGGDGEWKEKTEGHIKIHGVTVKTLQHLKDYMYLGVLPNEGLETLLVVASRYLMDKLKEDCSEKLLQSLKAENLDALIKLACQHDIPELVKALIYKTPDSILTDLHKLEIKGKESTDGDLEEL